MKKKHMHFDVETQYVSNGWLPYLRMSLSRVDRFDRWDDLEFPDEPIPEWKRKASDRAYTPPIEPNPRRKTKPNRAKTKEARKQRRKG